MRDTVGATPRLLTMETGTRYARPGVAMSELQRFARQPLTAGSRTWSIGGVPLTGTSADRAWRRYESSIETVLGDVPLRAVCTFDAATIAPEALDVMLALHEPHHDSAHPLPPESPTPDRHPDLLLQPTTAAEARAATTRWLDGRVDAERLDEVRLVTSELVTNSLVHGAHPVTLRGWVDPQRTVLQLSDCGSGIDRFADLRPSSGGPDGGFGLWLVGQLAAEVDIRRAAGENVVTAVLAH